MVRTVATRPGAVKGFDKKGRLRSVPRVGAACLDVSKNHDTIHLVTTIARDVPRIAQLCNALADEARVEIVARLLDGEKCVCDLTDALETGQSRLSYHLKVLKDAGLVSDRREGRWSYYTLSRDAFMEAEGLLTSLRPKATRALKTGCC